MVNTAAGWRAGVLHAGKRRTALGVPRLIHRVVRAAHVSARRRAVHVVGSRVQQYYYTRDNYWLWSISAQRVFVRRIRHVTCARP